MIKYNIGICYDKILVNVAAYVTPGSGGGLCVCVCACACVCVCVHVCVCVVRSKQE